MSPAELSPMAQRFLEHVPRTRPITARRVAHYSGLPSNRIESAVKELVRTGFLARLAERGDGSTLLQRVGR